MQAELTNDRRDDWHMTDRLHAEQGKGDPFAAAMRATRMPMIITDPRQDDNPIVFVNDAFMKLTGYARDEVMGRNCRFLQGPDSDRAAVARIAEALAGRNDIGLDILNYRKDGRPFWNALYISPVSNEAGELQYFFASQLDVTDRKEAEQRAVAEKDRFEDAVRERTQQLEDALETQRNLLHEVDHRVKNNLQMVSSLIMMEIRATRVDATKASLRAMLERVEALSTVHRRFYQLGDVASFDVGDFLRDLVGNLLAASGRTGIGARFDLEPVTIPAEKATPIALMVNELLTNAIKHAFAADGPDPVDGTIGIALERKADGLALTVSDDGRGLRDPTLTGGFGMRLVRSLARQLQANVSWSDGAPGTRVVIELPHRFQPDGEQS